MQPRFPSIILLLLTSLWVSQPVIADSAVIDTAKLVGTWQAHESHPAQGDIETVFTIHDDRTFAGTMAINNETVWSYGGTWALEGSSITWHYTQSSLALLEAHKTETDEILSLSDDSLTYRSGSRGSISTLQRRPDGQP
jgi:hypothetical protein